MSSGPAGLMQAASAYWSAVAHDFEHGGVNCAKLHSCTAAVILFSSEGR